jgi:hypothetical protein
MSKIVAIISAIFFTACGSNNESDIRQEKNGNLSIVDPTYVSVLEGQWRSACDDTPHPSGSSDKIVTVKANRIEIAENTYRDKSCSQLDYRTTSDSLFSVAKPSPHIDGIFINKKLKSYSWTVFNPDEIQERYNDIGFCGYSDWAINIPKDCSGTRGNDQAFPSKGSMKYNIFKVEGLVAYFGILDANIADERETSVNRNVPFRLVME